jgi:general stress protein 26
MQSTTPAELNDEDRSNILNFLRDHPVGVIATVDPEGNPHGSTIYFDVDDKLNITFTTKRDTRKHENVSRLNKVMLVVFDAEHQTEVQIGGKAEETTDPAEIQKIFHGTLRAASATGVDNVPPVAKIAAGPYVGYTVRPTDIWLSDYGWGDTFKNAIQHLHDAEPTDDPA